MTYWTSNSSCPPLTGDALRAAILACFSEDGGKVIRSLDSFSERTWQRELKWLDLSGLGLYLLDHLYSRGQEELLPTAILVRLRENLADNRQRAEAMLAEMIEISLGFERAGILCANLKGATLTPDSVPDLSLRLQLDLDFLVLDSDAEKGRRVLEAMGYALDCKSGNTWEFKIGGSELPQLKDIYKVKPQRSVELHLSPANGVLERVVRREFLGVELPVLSPIDVYLSQAEHLFKHLCSASTRAAWAIEAKRHIEARAADLAFWRSIQERVDGEPRLALAVSVAALLVEDVFGIALPEYLSELIDVQVSPGVRLWVERYGRQVLQSGAFGTKHYLLLLAELPAYEAGNRGSIRSWLIPRGLPPMITQGFAGERAGSRIRRYWIQLGFLVDRLFFHCVEGGRYLFESVRFRRLLAGVGH